MIPSGIFSINSSSCCGTGIEIPNSAAFAAETSAKLTRTPSITGNQRLWTWSGWVKRSNLDTYNMVFGSTISEGNNYSNLQFEANERLVFSHVFAGSNIFYKRYKPQLRDTASWYHIVMVYDADNASEPDRFKLYINGVLPEINDQAPVPLNQGTYINSTNQQQYGVYGTSQYFNGYMGETHFIDGQALTPDDFGYFNEIGEWVPKAYTGTYGANGFYLDFQNGANLGEDKSGNGNNWTNTNVTQSTDTPSSNAAILNTVDTYNAIKGGFTDTAKLMYPSNYSSGNWFNTGLTHKVPDSGKYYIEFDAKVRTGGGNESVVGLIADSYDFGIKTTASRTHASFSGLMISLFSDWVYSVDNGTATQRATGITASTVRCMIAIDIDNGKLWTGNNGTWHNSGDPVAGTGNTASDNWSNGEFKFISTVGVDITNTDRSESFLALTEDSWTYTPPTGYKALSTANLPEPEICNPKEWFKPVLYTGNGTAQSITGVGFSPDFVWIKQRSGAAQNHYLLDTVRGAGYRIQTDTTAIEDYQINSVSSFDTDGFSVGSSVATNADTESYVAWCFNAGNGSPVTNTNGSITSTVKAAPNGWFSIVSYSGGGTDYPTVDTVGHGLGVAPEFVIVKDRDTASTNWPVYHKDLADDYILALNLTGAQSGPNANSFGRVDPTNTVFTVGQATGGSRTNDSGAYIAYLFASVEGFCKVGSYTGNGSADGPFVYTGFKPAFVLIKNVVETSNWGIYDATRNPYNEIDAFVGAETSAPEFTGLTTNNIDFLSNGFKQKATTNYNISGSTYIYLAIAETPFIYSRAR